MIDDTNPWFPSPSWSVLYHLFPTCFRPYRIFLSLIKYITFPLSDIIAICTQFNCTLRGNDIHSHQNLKPKYPVPLEVHLNEGCDKYVGDFCITTDTRWHMIPTATPPPSDPSSLNTANTIPTNNYRSHLTDAYSSISVHNYLLEKKPSWTASVTNTKEWYHLGIALTTIFKKSKPDFSCFVKFMNSMSNTGAPKKMFTENQRTMSLHQKKCPFCKSDTETTTHNLFTWTHEEIQISITSSIKTLFTSLQQVKIPLDMWLTILAGVGSFLGREVYIPISTERHQLALQHAYDDQTSIEWGFFSRAVLHTARVTLWHKTTSTSIIAIILSCDTVSRLLSSPASGQYAISYRSSEIQCCIIQRMFLLSPTSNSTNMSAPNITVPISISVYLINIFSKAPAQK